MKKVLFVSHFDPFTNRHIDFIKKVSSIVDKLYLGISINPEKKHFFNNDNLIQIIKDSLKPMLNVEVCMIPGSIAHFCIENGISTVIRSLRKGMTYLLKILLCSFLTQTKTSKYVIYFIILF